jgi:aryl-alcohol dehydrogenase-like predicted oxidoreductase
MDQAWSLGVRAADTALSYGSHEAVNRLAAWSRSNGNAFAVTAKLGRPVVNGEICPDYSASGLRSEFEVYLRAGLKIDTVLLKDPPPEVLTSGKWEHVLNDAIGEMPGLNFGFSTHNLAACCTIPPPNCRAIAQIPINAVNWQEAAAALGALDQVGFDVWAMQPLAAGFLTASQSPEKKLHPDDWRTVYPEAVLRRKRHVAQTVADRLSQAAPHLPIAASALLFLLGEPRLQKIIIGPRLPHHLEACAMALNAYAQQVECA